MASPVFAPRVLAYSIVIPVHNEEDQIRITVENLIEEFRRESIISYEIVLVDDNSEDNTAMILEELKGKYSTVRPIHRTSPCGFGRAIRDGITHANGNVICIVMGDESDIPEDVIKLLKKVDEGFDVAYGNRFLPQSKIVDYPILKFYVNRFANHLFRLMFRISDKDISNAFKAYHYSVFNRIGPIESTQFDITLELPVKAHLIRCSHASVPVKWMGRKSGVTKFSLIRMCRPYILTALKLFLLSLVPTKMAKNFHNV